MQVTMIQSLGMFQVDDKGRHCSFGYIPGETVEVTQALGEAWIYSGIARALVAPEVKVHHPVAEVAMLDVSETAVMPQARRKKRA